MLEDFYSIVNQTIAENSVIVRVRFNIHHPIFQGHFPTMPVVPGACLVEMACELSSKFLGKKLQLSMAQNVKFVKVIHPDQVEEVSFDILWSESEGGYVTKCLVHNEGDTYAMMKITLSESVC